LDKKVWPARSGPLKCLPAESTGVGLVPVDSSAVAWVLYHPARRDLDVGFHAGSAYRYHGVSAKEYADLLAADSIGAYVNETIKRHEFTKLR